ncbi:MAG TPA: hypothetical protein VM324_10100 [Egibacteraceae bacterium]|nr:hypothetical protein [Egibacteraceae bacterium]
MAVLGHSSIAITGDVYSDVTPGMQAEADARVARIIQAAPDADDAGEGVLT